MAAIEHFVVEANAAQRHFRLRKLFFPWSQRFPDDAPVESAAACRHAFAMKFGRGLATNELFVLTTQANLFDHEDDEYFYVTGLDSPSTARTCPKVGVLSLFYLVPGSDFNRTAEENKRWRRTSNEDRNRTLSASIVLNLLSAVTTSVMKLPTHKVTRGCVMDYCQRTFDVIKPLGAGFPFCDLCKTRLDSSSIGGGILAIARRLMARPFFMQPPKIFIAYSRVDSRPAARLQKDLIDRGYHDVFIDTKVLEGGSRWPEASLRRLRDSDFVVICQSSRSEFGGFFLREIQEATRLVRQRPVGFVLPVRWDDCTLRPELRHLNAIDLFPRWAEAVDRLSASIALHQARRVVPGP